MPRHLTLAIFLTLSAAGIAQDWTGALNSDWNEPGNWSDWPLDGENVTIDPANYTGAMAQPAIATASVFIPDRLFVDGGTLTIAAGLTVADRFIVSGPGAVDMTGGVLTSDRLVLDLGGAFHLGAGAITITSVLALADGTAEVDSRFEQGGGTVTVTGELGFECETGTFSPTYHQTGGTLVVNGDMVWFGAAPGGGRPRFISISGATAINGMVLNSPNSTVDLHLELHGGALTTDGTSIELAHPTDSIVMTAGSWQVDGDVSIENDGVVHITSGPVVFLQAAELRGAGSYQFHDVQLYTGSSLQHSDPQEIAVSGSWLDQGAFDPDVNTVVFNGSTSQLITAGNFHGLRMNNSGPGVLLADACTVEGPLELLNGLIHAQGNAVLSLLPDASATSGSATSYVSGPMKRIGGDAFVFPVGKNGSWRRIGVAGINDQDTEFTAEYFTSAFANTTSLGAGLMSVSATEHWSLTRTGTTDDARVQLHWEDASASSIGDCSTLVCASWDGAAWQGAPSTTTGSCAGNDAGAVQSDEPVTTYNVFTFGAGDGSIGISEAPALHTPLVTPNPANERIIRQHPAMAGPVQVFDALGQLIITTKASTIEVSTWTEGVYFVKIGERMQRIVVQH